MHWLLGLSLAAAAAITAGYHLNCEVRTLSLPEPMGMWETSYAAEARVWPNEYQYGNYVCGHDNYGPGYPAFCRPFLAALGDVYVAHRASNLVAIAGACCLLVGILRGNGCPWPECAATTAIFYSLFAGSYSVQARPDFLSALLMLAVLGAGQPRFWRGRNPVAVGIVVGALSLAAYFTKPYALLAYAVAAGAVLLWAPWRWAFVAIGTSAAIFVGGLWAYSAFNPYYLFESFTALRASTHVDASWFVSQLGDFLFVGGGILVVSGWTAARAIRIPGDQNTRYWTFAALAGLGALLAGPAWHPGSYLTYYFHLLLPQVCVLAALGSDSASGPGSRWPWRRILLGANLGVIMATAPAPPAPDPGWNALAEDVRRQPGPLVADFLMEPIVRGRTDAEVLGYGLTAFALAEPSTVPEPGAVGRRAADEAAAYEAAMRARLTHGRPPEAVYIETVALPGEGALSLHGLAPRGGLAYLLGGVKGYYKPAAIFRIHPYGLSTNTPRQLTGRWESYIVKMVRSSP